MRILIVEDEPGLVEFLRLELELEGNQVVAVTTGHAALRQFATEPFDAVLLDWMLPDLDGVEVCRRMRAVSDVPVVMVTARGDVLDRVVGLDAGADDYLVKPFAIEELMARIRAAVRRTHLTPASNSSDDPFLFGDVAVYVDRRKVFRRGIPVDLTAREFDLLVHFLRNPNHVFTRDELLLEVWGFEHPVDTNVVDVYVGYLRHKLDPQKRYLCTVRGIGFAFQGEAP